ncbi:MAG: alpha/beta fold hydrolase [Bryobacteraceae bacterium]
MTIRIAVLLLAALGLAWADDFGSREGDFIIRNFTFRTGEKLDELRIHYTTIGQPHRNGQGIVDNAVLILHGTGGQGRGFLSEEFGGQLFVPGGLLDTRRYFIILPDGIGHGKSSKPSDGLRMKFPRYTYADMIRAQHLLLTEGLKVDHLRLVTGTSMGGMHTWLWGVTYPSFMDALMPLASAPVEIAGRNRLFRKMVMESIRRDPDWKGGDYTTPPLRGLQAMTFVTALMSSAPHQMYAQAPTRELADAMFEKNVLSKVGSADANDILYHFDSSREYNPWPDLERIRAPLVAINSADDEVNPPDLGILEKAMQRIPKARYVLIPTGPETRGHSTHSRPRIWKAELERLMRESSGGTKQK